MPKRTVDILLEIISPEKMLVHQMSTVNCPVQGDSSRACA